MQYDIFAYYDIGNLARVSDPRSEDDFWTRCTVPKSKVPSEGQPTWKVSHSVLQKVINIFLLISTLRS